MIDPRVHRLRPPAGRSALVWVVALLAARIFLVLLAQTFPCDQLWIAGIYDAADMDVLLHAVTTLEGTRTSDPPALAPIVACAAVPASTCPERADMGRESLQARAPPDRI